MLQAVVHGIRSVELWVLGGGGVAIAGAILRLSFVLGRVDQTIKSIDDRVRRLEDQSDRRQGSTPVSFERRHARGET